jgi:ribose transport system permease protein
MGPQRMVIPNLVGGSERAAKASGINVTWIKIFAFLVSGVFVALAALCVVGQTATGDARSGQGFTLNSVAAAVIGGIAFSGGKGNYVGAIIGGIILGLLINIIYFANVTSFYQVFTKGAIILVALVIGAVPRLRRELSQR